jgi:hypothetical protein
MAVPSPVAVMENVSTVLDAYRHSGHPEAD